MAKFFSEGVYNEKVVAKASRVHPSLPKFDSENAQVYFDIEIGNPNENSIKRKERVVFELFTK